MIAQAGAPILLAVLAAGLVVGCGVALVEESAGDATEDTEGTETKRHGKAQRSGESLPSVTSVPSVAMPRSNGGDRMAWFNEARFGMFIHWGVYAVPAGEWKGGTGHAEWIMLTGDIPSAEYEKFPPQFNPVRFDAKEWVRLAKDAGMKYMVITAKHHDGFCMYDTALTEYSIVKATPYGRDPMKELAAACGEAGLKFCFYYSNVDWHHPEFPQEYSQRGFHGDPNPDADIEKYVTYMKGQVRELLTNYGPIGIMWFDGGGSFRGQPMAELLHSQEIIDMIRELQPRCLVNNRLRLPADYGTPEQHIPGRRPKHAFEVCMTLNRHWGYNKHDSNWKEAREVIRKLVDIASKGGNYLLNVGPTAEGLIPADSVRILREVGGHMERIGEAIYGTAASPFDYTPPWGRFTAKGRKIFLHVLDWPEDGRLRVERLKTPTVRAYLLAEREHMDAARSPLEVERDGDDVVVTVPAEAPDPVDTVVVMELAGDPDVIPKAAKQAADGTITLKAIDAIIHGETARYEADEKQGKDNIGYWTDAGDWVSWFVQVARPGSFTVDVTYACPGGTTGAEYAVAIGGQEVTGKVEATDSWTAFKTHRVGTLAIENAGRSSLSLKPITKPGFAVMNLQSVVLTPRR